MQRLDALRAIEEVNDPAGRLQQGIDFLAGKLFWRHFLNNINSLLKRISKGGQESKMIEEIERLIAQPRESLSVEIKAWLDLDNPVDQAKIIKTLIALRNNNGGFMIFGFHDKTLAQDKNAPENPEALFHPDKIQGWVTKYSSEPFEVDFQFPEREGIKHPVLIVPGGVKSVVAAKANLMDENGNKLIAAHDVYVRSLLSNHTPSTTRPRWGDWPSIIQVCFDNREADIGNFLRRHLRGLSGEDIISAIGSPVKKKEDIAKEFFKNSMDRYYQVIKERGLTLPEHGSWACALIINGDIPKYRANKDFLRMLDASNPQYTGWPVWMNSEGFTDKSGHPYVHDRVWEALLVTLGHGWSDHIDFLRFDPEGKFFIRRSLEDDIGAGDKQPLPLSQLEFGLTILRTAETVAVGLAFAKAMGCNPEDTTLIYMFQWEKLKGRELSSWADLRRHLSIGRKAYQDTVESIVEIPLDTPLSRVGEYVKILIDPLFEVFDGFEISQGVVDDLTNKLLNRKL